MAHSLRRRAPLFSLSPWERAGVRASERTRLKQKATSVAFFNVFSLSLWERAGVRASERKAHEFCPAAYNVADRINLLS